MSDYAEAVADRIVERGESEWQRRQDAQARKAGRYVEFKPSDRAIKSSGPTCPRCDAGVVLSGNMAFCNRRSCRWQGLGVNVSRSLSVERISA